MFPRVFQLALLLLLVPVRWTGSDLGTTGIANRTHKVHQNP